MGDYEKKQCTIEKRHAIATENEKKVFENLSVSRARN